MRNLLDSVLFGFVAISESQFILWLVIAFFAFACFLLFNRAAIQRRSFAVALVLTRRMAGSGIGLVLAFLVTVLLMATGVDKKYYFLLFEFVSAAWLPTTLLIACFFMYARTFPSHSEYPAPRCDVDQDVVPPKA
ncbi:MAG TPA: hypothetical protein PKV17_10300 [Aquabacterium sp.]|jgi:hypothetical protein|nr:hypothetical protein [Aquabacterium sp.]HRH16177.1 hypothetical protein [Aquabacterium sp.]HRH29158.1 hypothetical protein [Aquabacterium sp.]